MARTTDLVLSLACASALAVSVCGGCYRGAVAARTSPPDPALQADMAARAVRVDFVCMDPDLTELSPMVLYGSGVVVDSDHVMTAEHVAHCPVGLGRAIVTTADERYVAVKLERASVVLDVALLVAVTPGEFSGVPPLSIADELPGEGATVCMAAAVPKRVVNCGVVDRVGDFPPKNLHYTANSTYGNSGGGVYDKVGRLVGINTHCDLRDGDKEKPPEQQFCDPVGGGSGSGLGVKR